MTYKALDEESDGQNRGPADESTTVDDTTVRGGDSIRQLQVNSRNAQENALIDSGNDDAHC